MKRALGLAFIATCMVSGPLALRAVASPLTQPIVIVSTGPSHDALKHITRGQYLSQIQQLQQTITACKAQASACDAGAAGDDVAVDANGPDAPAFDARRDWLRSALTTAKDAKDSVRADLMTKVQARLDGDLSEVSAAPETLPSEAEARSKADTILDRTEFRAVEPNSYWAQKMAIIGLFLSELFSGAISRMPHAPWLPLVLECAVLMSAAAGLLIWAWRTMQQQKLSVAAPSTERLSAWQKESDDWAKRAQAEAERGEWREAVHCLYWAAIVMLEGKKLWRSNRARTPREYLPLLEPGSPRQRALGGLTRIFERIWYGLRPADRNDFERAQALLEELKAA